MLFFAEAAAACLLFTALVIPTFYRDPLSWISDYPPAIRQRAWELGLIPATQEKMPARVLARKLIFSLLTVVQLTLLLVYGNGAKSFLQGFGLSYGLWTVVAWYDALVIDCLWFCHSKRAVLPGTEDLKNAYHDYWFHIRMSLLGMVIGLPVCLLTGACVALLASCIA